MYQQNGETNSQGTGQTNQMYFPLFMNHQQSNQAVQYLTGELTSASCYSGVTCLRRVQNVTTRFLECCIDLTV